MNDYLERYKVPILVLIPLVIISGVLVFKLTNGYISQVKILGPVRVTVEGVTGVVL